MAHSQRIRVPQPPPNECHQPCRSVSDSQLKLAQQKQLSYGQLVQLANRQRRQIEMNTILTQHKESQLQLLKREKSESSMMANRIVLLRRQVVEEETEMDRLKQIQSSAVGHQRVNTMDSLELNRLRMVFSQKENDLRRVIDKMDSLRTELNRLKTGRRSAARAAMAMALAVGCRKQENSNARIENPLSNAHPNVNDNRPQTTAEPFEVSGKNAQQNNTQWSFSNPFANREKTSTENDHTENAKVTEENFEREQTPLEPARKSPSPPGDPTPSDQSMTNNGRSIDINDVIQEAQKAFENETPPPDLISVLEWTKQQKTESKSNAEDADFYRCVETDQLTLRNDTLRAAKRRSWAQDGVVSEETENIRRVLRDEQRKGRSHINFGFIFHELQQQQHTTDFCAENSVQCFVVRPPPSYQMQKGAIDVDSVGSSDCGSNSGFSDDSPHKSAASNGSPLPSLLSSERGILKATHTPTRRRRDRHIEFHPLALLLDGALEGELELVEQCAKKLSSVSLCNDEGITPLHNAICAGHLDIVRFLVESHADVNAQDSDGWTPLHCAASCNNLTMVRFLVERGACAFATTLSDHETPADKCEQDEDGFQSCSRFLAAVQAALGRAAERMVYAAYSYKAVNDDELSFEDGDALKVESRDCDEKAWWWCSTEDGRQNGYVPRNFLAVCPRLSARTKDHCSIDQLEQQMVDWQQTNAEDGCQLKVDQSPAINCH